MKKEQPKFNVLLWDINRDNLEYYDVIPYFVSEWKEDKKHKHKAWNLEYNQNDSNIDDTKMPETFEEFKKYILRKSQYMYWSRSEYEIIISDWPCQKHEKKIDVHYQIEMNIDIIAKLFMDFIK